ncbi:VOC family protein [Mucilaginibacter ginkgonis]|uniref:VOC family protein n=1 Tax=Mucilaginibacter ginkgonis TaxID=2682091 RepID=A0A7T7F9W5_9SPHI|nr:VOC family protein [Mucilaginibacter ginkgonis]QQL49488.1 VOC family protein [Mucilaginibacter ginkgonis]
MKNVNFPGDYQQIMPYLIVPSGLRFISFMKKVFGAQEKGERHMRDEFTIQHAELTVGQSVIMLADSTDNYPPQTAGMFIYVDDCDTVYQVALDEGAISVMPPNDMPYGRSAGIKDPVGNIWWVTSV